MSSKSTPQQDAKSLAQWYLANRRTLPWRATREPYRIWISEVMCQQTTIAAVVPYYLRFLERFPTLESLASASIEDVYEMWAGLGYYSRARNLHKAAQSISELGKFPETFSELIEFPGFGPYTARAVSSLCFDERVGVIDGNVIRVLSRRHGLSLDWWQPKERAKLQHLADELVQNESPTLINQGLMELGAIVCTVKNPACLLCPWAKSCVARKTGEIQNLPKPKPRKKKEIWLWKPELYFKNESILVVRNSYAPFLRNHWIWPGEVRKLKSPPKTYDYRGTVTNFDIFVNVQKSKRPAKAKDSRWIDSRSSKKEIPASLIRKALDYA